MTAASYMFEPLRLKGGTGMLFEEGETVRVIAGPYANSVGTVVKVKAEQQRIHLKVSIFGNATLVELDFAQVEKS